MLDEIKDTFYAQPSSELLKKWLQWMKYYLSLSGEEEEIARMKKVNPKYVPREWMLKEAYTKANQMDFSMIDTLNTLFQSPYEEHPALEALYYRKAPP